MPKEVLPKATGLLASGKPDKTRLEWLTRELLLAIGIDPEEPRVKDTPARVARWWFDLMTQDHGTLHTTFEQVRADQMVVVSGMRVWSVCEHHLLPYYTDLTIAYFPNGRVLGLSKFGRIARACASKPSIQERLVHEIAETIKQMTGSHDVAVLASGEHLCMTMRGVRMPAKMTSSVLEGAFRHDPSVRAEFFGIATRG